MNGKKVIPIRKADSVNTPRGEITYLFLKTNNTLWAKMSDGTTVQVGGGGGGQLVISDTWANINASKIAGTLTPGALYEVTDHEMKYILPGTDTSIMSHGVRPIFVLALTSDTFSQQAYDPQRPNLKLGYDFDDNEITIDYDYLSGDLSTLPTGDKIINVNNYGTNWIDFTKKPIGQYNGNSRYFHVNSNGHSQTYDYTDEGVTYTLVKVGNYRRMTFLDYAYDFVTNDGYIEIEVGVLVDNRNGWINYFYDVEKNIEAFYDIEEAMVRRYFGTEYINGSPTGRTGYWLTREQNTMLINTYGGSSHQIVVSPGIYQNVKVLGMYAQSLDVKISAPLSNNISFVGYVNSCEILNGVYNMCIQGNAYKSKIFGTFSDVLLPALNHMDIHYNATMSGIYKPLGSGIFQEFTMMTGTTYAYNIVSPTAGLTVNIIDETLYPGTVLRRTTFGLNQISKNHYYGTQFIYNNFTGSTGSSFTGNQLYGGYYEYNNFQSLQIVEKNVIRLGRNSNRTTYFRYNTAIQNMLGCDLNVAGNIEYNEVIDWTGITADIVDGGVTSITHNKATTWLRLFLGGPTNNNTVRVIQDSKFYRGLENNTGDTGNVWIKTTDFFSYVIDNVFDADGQIEGGRFMQDFSQNQIEHTHQGITARCPVIGVVDTQHHTGTQYDIQLTKDSPRQFFELLVDGVGNLSTNEFIF